jgi:hypothetical protein
MLSSQALATNLLQKMQWVLLMWRTRLEVEALLEKSDRTRKKAAEIQRQLRTLILYWERLLQRQRCIDAGLEDISYNDA